MTRLSDDKNIETIVNLVRLNYGLDDRHILLAAKHLGLGITTNDYKILLNAAIKEIRLERIEQRLGRIERRLNMSDFDYGFTWDAAGRICVNDNSNEHPADLPGYKWTLTHKAEKERESSKSVWLCEDDDK